MLFSAPAKEGSLVPGHAPLCPPGATPAHAIVWMASLHKKDPEQELARKLQLVVLVVLLTILFPILHLYKRRSSFPVRSDARAHSALVGFADSIGLTVPR